MKNLFTLFTVLAALVGLQANAAIYLVGQTPTGNGWDPSKGIEMTDNNDGTYTYNVAISGTVYFCFADQLASSSSDWNTFNNSYRYSPTSSNYKLTAGTWAATGKNGDKSYMFTGSGETYTITFDLTNKKVKVEGYVEEVDPSTGNLYVLGNINGNGWDPSVGAAMTADGNTYTLENCTVDDAGDGYGYFSFTAMLSDPTSENGWSEIGAYRIGAQSDGDFLITDEYLGTPLSLAGWGTSNAFKCPTGTYTMTVNTEAMTLTITSAGDTPEPVEDTPVYILGEVNGNTWSASNGVAMTYDSETGKYTASVTTAGENDGYSYFSFTKALAAADSETAWDDIAASRFGAVSEGDFLVLKSMLGEELALDADGTSNAFKLVAGTWTFTLDLTNRTLVIEGEGTWPGEEEETTDALYVLGEVNGNTWSASNGVAMTYDSESRKYTATVTTAGENDGYSYFSFSTKLADAESESAWDDIAAYRYGMSSDGDFLMTEELLGVPCTMLQSTNPNAVKIPAGTWTLTVDLNALTLTIDGTWPAGEDTTVVDEDTPVYILGEVNGNTWSASNGVAMTYDSESGKYTATVTTAGENDGYSYFSFTTKLADAESETAWDDIADYRYGMSSDGDFLMTEELLGVPCTMLQSTNPNAVKIPAGTWTLTVDLNALTLTIDGTWPAGEDTTVVVEDTPVYILGEVNGNSWDATNGVQMTYNSETGKYTANVTTAGENNGYSYFSFTKALAAADSETPWDDIAASRFGAVSNGDFLVLQNMLGKELALDADSTQNAFMLVAGTWTFTLDLANRTLVINGEGTWPTTGYDGDVYVLGEVNDNGGWFPNVGSQMTRDDENGVYAITITTAGENDGYSYFSFTKALAENDGDNGGWEEIADSRLGATAGDYEVTEDLLGQKLTIVSGDNAFKIGAGTWKVTLSVDESYVIIEAAADTDEHYYYGDVNHDQEVNISDVTRLIDRVLANKNIDGVDGRCCETCCDVNIDGEINISDVTALIDYVLTGNFKKYGE